MIKLAINWAAACGGCDVALLDLEQALVELTDEVQLVYWPVALDYKRDQLRALAPGSVDVGLFNGAVRTSEQQQDALLLREKCKLLVALGSCACFGGIPGLANTVASGADLLDTVYGETASTDNPEDLRPQPSHVEGAARLELPRFDDRVRALHQVTEVDLFAPGCPPPAGKVAELAAALRALARGEQPPPRGTVLAADRGLCGECPRQPTRGTRAVERFVRPHELVADPEVCLLDQGIVCLGIATRGGCGATCIAANMPCRGCFGPLPGQRDPAAELASALAVLPGPRGAWEMPVHKIVGPAKTMVDPLGTFYRFSYPISPGRGTLPDGASPAGGSGKGN